VGEIENARGEREREKKKKREMRLDTKLENRGKVVPSPLSFPLYSLPLSPRHGRSSKTYRYFLPQFFGAFFNMQKTDDDNDDGIVSDVVTPTSYRYKLVIQELFIYFGILFVTWNVTESEDL